VTAGSGSVGSGVTFTSATPLHSFPAMMTGGAQFAQIKTVRVRAGHLGQLWVDNRIVWESKPYKTARKASDRARRHRAERIGRLFG
jgi:hypothetical protein